MRLQISKVSDTAEIAPNLLEAVSTNHLLSMIVKQTLDVMSVETCIIWINDKSGNLIPRMSFGLKTSLIQSAKIRVTSAFVKCIMAKDKPTNIYNLAGDRRVPIKRIIKSEGLKSLLAEPLVVGDEKIGVLMVCAKTHRRFTAIDLKVFNALAKQSALTIYNINLYDRTNTTMLERVRKDYLNTIKTLAKVIDANDPCARGHCDKVMKYSLLICRKLKLPVRSVNAIKTASLLHDIGKIGIDMNIIRKPGKLTPEDWDKVKTHPEIGAKIVEQVGFLNEVVPIIRCHHERFGGGGYPDPGRSGLKIPLGSRIIAVADAFDAMTSDRPYREALSKKEAMEELERCAGSQFDPEIVKAFKIKA